MVGGPFPPSSEDPSWDLLQPFPGTSVVLQSFGEKASEKHSQVYQVHVGSNDVRLAEDIIQAGELTWNTGDVVEEVSPGWFRLLYRDDDILVHTSGECVLLC